MIALLLSLVAAGAAQASKPAEPVRFGGFLAQIDGLEEPSSVAVGPNDEIYVVERFADRVRVFDATGKELARFGATHVVEPQGIAVGADGTTYVSNTGGDWVEAFDRDGQRIGVTRSATSSSSEDAVRTRPRNPLGLACASGRLSIADSRGGSIVVWTLDTPGAIRAETRVDDLDVPVDVALDPEGNTYVAELGKHRVTKLDPSGRVLLTWGDFGPYPGQFASPTGIDFRAGRVYVADRDNHRIQVFDTRGKLVYDWGIHALRPHEGQGRLHYPNDVAIAPSGRFAAVCEGFENRVQLFGIETEESTTLARRQERDTSSHFGFGITTAGKVAALVEPSAPGVLVYDLTQEEPIEITRFGSYGRTVGAFLAPIDAEFDPSGDLLFVADPVAHRIDAWSVAREPDEPLRFDPLLARLVQSLDFSHSSAMEDPKRRHRVRNPRADERATSTIEPVALHCDRRGRLWVVDAAAKTVLRVDLAKRGDRIAGFEPRDHGVAPTGSRLESRGVLPPFARPWFDVPTDLATSVSGELLYVVDAGKHKVTAFRVDDGLEPAFTFGMQGTGAGEFVRPTGICAGVDGFVYVTDEGGHRVLKFDEKGTFVAAWGAQGLGRVEFYKPRGITQAADGKLYIVDYGNHRGQLLTPDGGFVLAFGSRLFTQPTRTTKQ